MFPSISCEFIDFESLKRGYLSRIPLTKKILANSRLIEIFFFSNFFTYILEGYLSDSIKTGCILSFCRTKSDRTNRGDWVPLVRLSSVIELTEKFLFDYARLPNQSNNNVTDWVRLSSTDFWFGFVRLTTNCNRNRSNGKFRGLRFRNFENKDPS